MSERKRVRPWVMPTYAEYHFLEKLRKANVRLNYDDEEWHQLALTLVPALPEPLLDIFPILDCPSDVFTQILAYCEYAEVKALQHTCPRMLNKTIEDTPHWEASCDGYEMVH